MIETASSPEKKNLSQLSAIQKRPFDGVVCFGGEDYWYHNRGHYDMQLMRELSARLPVLYINSIGMRIPSLGEGTVFLQRLWKKIGSLKRGLVRVRENFFVFSPVMLPGDKGKAITKTLMTRQIKRAIRKMGISRPLVWVACPPGVAMLEDLDPVGVVYQRTDRFEEYPRVDKELIRSYDRQLKSRADLTLFCSSSVMKEEREQCQAVLFADHGVDFDRFSSAGEEARSEPPEFREIPHPRVGFIGAIDAHTFDPVLFNEVAARLPDVNFALVGKVTLDPDWCPHSHVHFIDRQPYEKIAEYMAANDVLIMPWVRSEWIKACNPVKLKEYLAVGRPVVSRWFEELRRYEGFVHVADSPEDFAQAIRAALSHPDTPSRLRGRVEPETWDSKCGAVLEQLACQGLVPDPRLSSK
jgi:glycosyltransferase involved in cell wall biosynthesis